MVTQPRYADETTLLCDLAAHLLAERIAKYPAAIAAGKLTQAKADDGIRVMRAVAARWSFRPLWESGDPHTCAQAFASEREMHATLVNAAARTAQIAAADPTNSDKADYAQACDALRWHAARWAASQDAASAVLREKLGFDPL